MNEAQPNLIIKVDVTNPGQFFACCGLFELAHRLWPGVEAYFDGKGGFHLTPLTSQNGLELLENLRVCAIEGLDEEKREERKRLEKHKRDLKKLKQKPSEQEEARRKELGDRARAGSLTIGEPFSLFLDWWQTEDEKTPKTWAGQQEVHKTVRAAQIALPSIAADGFDTFFDFFRVLPKPGEYKSSGKGTKEEKVAPFYFDARLRIHSLDVGFSLDAQKMEIMACPPVELLALVGLQRFRPKPTQGGFDYWVWCNPLPISVAAAMACGAVLLEPNLHFRFRSLPRSDRKELKAYQFSTLIKGE